MAVEQGVPLNPGAGGYTARTLEVTVLQANGQLATVEMQVVSIANARGRVLDFDNLEGAIDRLTDVMEDVLFELRLQNETSEDA